MAMANELTLNYNMNTSNEFVKPFKEFSNKFRKKVSKQS